MSTPEGKVKEKVTKLLKETPHTYYFMPVQAGYGAPGLDYHCTCCGLSFFVETKAPGKQLTERQKLTKQKMEQAGGLVFKVSSDRELKSLQLWLERTTYIRGKFYAGRERGHAEGSEAPSGDTG